MYNQNKQNFITALAIVTALFMWLKAGSVDVRHDAGQALAAEAGHTAAVR